MEFWYALLELLLFFSLIIYSGIRRFKPVVWIPVIAIAFAGLSFSHVMFNITIVLITFIYVGLICFLVMKKTRQHYFTSAVMYFVKQKMPPMSKTEKEALAAGDIWWEQGLFQGAPKWQELENFKKPFLTEEETAFFNHQVKRLCHLLNDWEINYKYGDLSQEAWDYLKKEKFFGMNIPKSYGGLEFSAFAQSKIISQIASRCYSGAITVMVPNSLGPGELLHRYGTEEQKNYYLPKLACGEEIPCFALTGPTAGSDAASIPDNGYITKGHYNGQECVGIRLNWDKRYITLAPKATLIGLAVKIFDPEHLLGEKENLGITVLFVSSTLPGVESGARHLPMGQHFLNGPTRGQDVFVPLDAIVGGADNIGKGWQMLMECLAIGRGISLPALSTGMIKLCCLTTSAYSRVREQFKTPIGYFQGVEAKLARIGAYTYMADACRRLTLRAVNEGIKAAIPSAMTKYHLTEMARVVVNDAMDIHGGRAVQMGPKNYLANAYMGVPIIITVEGANILTRSLIIFSQGIIRNHPYLGQEMEILNQDTTEKSIAAFDKLLLKHFGFLFQNFSKTIFYGLTRGAFITTPGNGLTAHYYRQISYMSAAFAFLSDVTLMVMRGSIKRCERMSGRLGDIVSQLYIASGVLKYYEDRGCLLEDYPYVEWCMAECFYKIQLTYDKFFANFPHRRLARLLKFFIFPYGPRYTQGPTDRSSHKVAQDILRSCEIREAMTRDCYVGEDGNSPVYIVENAFQKVLNSEEGRKKLRDAIALDGGLRHASKKEQLAMALEMGVLTADEISNMVEAQKAVEDALGVDEFDEWKGGLCDNR